MLTDKEVVHISELARLKLSKDEISSFKNELSSVLEYAGKLNEVNTSEVKVGEYGQYEVSPMRKDNAENIEWDTKKILEQAPGKTGNLVKVKAVLKKNDE
jgi:aspartyl-tRNA(Asn)/glutamyl-tRNA(Gln) amidotransferase subunit C